MQKRRCPYIGLENDPSTVMSYPTLQNCCHRVEPEEPVNLNYQLTHCFTFAHRHCPVLLGDSITGLPPEIAVYSTKKRATIALWFVVASGMLTAVFILLFGDWQWGGANGGFLDFNNDPTPQEITETPGFQQEFAASTTPVFTLTPSSTLAETAISEPSKTAESTEPTATDEPRFTNTSVPAATSFPTWTPVIFPTNTPFPTSTFPPLPTNTSRPTETRSPTNTARPTNTPAATNTPLPTHTSPPVPSDTPVPIPTDAPLPTGTSTPIPLPPTNSPNP